MENFYIPLILAAITGLVNLITKRSSLVRPVLFWTTAILMVVAFTSLRYYRGVVDAYESITNNVENSKSYNYSGYKGLTGRIYFSKDSFEVMKHLTSFKDSAALKALEGEFAENFKRNWHLDLDQKQKELKEIESWMALIAIVLTALFILRYVIDTEQKKKDQEGNQESLQEQS